MAMDGAIVDIVPWNSNLPIVLSLTAVFSIAWALSWLLALTGSLHGHFTNDPCRGGVQKIHCLPVPRIGGLAIASAVLGGGFLANAPNASAHDFRDLHNVMAISILPALLVGLIEDVTQRVNALPRLILTLVGGALFALLSGVWLTHIDVPLFDPLLTHSFFGIAFTAFAMAGVANAINIIDGLHGLAGGVALLILIAIGILAQQFGDTLVAHFALIGTMAVLGFLLVNFPRGRLFMGDGGAYFVGFFIAQLAVLLAVRNPEISPWTLVTICAYPVTETLYSVYRRMVSHRHPELPDRTHLHSLLYARVVRPKVPRDRPAYLANALTSPLLWALALPPAILALLWPDSTIVQLVILCGFISVYSLIYTRLVRFRWHS